MPLRHLIALIINAHHSAVASAGDWDRVQPMALIRKTSLSSDRSDGVRSSSRQNLIRTFARDFRTIDRRAECSEIARRTRLASRPMLGAILPLHDVRYLSDPGQLTCAARTEHRASPTSLAAERRRAIVIFTDEQKARSDPSWWSQTGSNRRPPACKAGALPTELWPLELWHVSRSAIGDRALSLARPDVRLRRLIETFLNLVGLGRLELPTSRLSSARSNQLSYKPGSLRSYGPAARHPDANSAQLTNRDVQRCGGTGLVREERET